MTLMILMTLMTSDVRPAASTASHDATRRRRYLTATTLFTFAAHALTASAFSLTAAALTLAATALAAAVIPSGTLFALLHTACPCVSCTVPG